MNHKPIDQTQASGIPASNAASVRKVLESKAFALLESTLRFSVSASTEVVNEMWRGIDSPKKAATMLAVGAGGVVIALNSPWVGLVIGAPMLGVLAKDRLRELLNLSSSSSSEEWGRFVGKLSADGIQFGTGYKAFSKGTSIALSHPVLPPSLPRLIPGAHASTPHGITVPVTDLPHIVFSKGIPREVDSIVSKVVRALIENHSPESDPIQLAILVDRHSLSAEQFKSLSQQLGFNWRRALLESLDHISEFESSPRLVKELDEGFIGQAFEIISQDGAMDTMIQKAIAYVLSSTDKHGPVIVAELGRIISEKPKVIRRLEGLLTGLIEKGGANGAVLNELLNFRTPAQIDFASSYFIRHIHELSADDQLLLAGRLLRLVSANRLARQDTLSRTTAVVAKLLGEISPEILSRLLAVNSLTPSKRLLIDGTDLIIDRQNSPVLYAGAALCEARVGRSLLPGNADEVVAQRIYSALHAFYGFVFRLGNDFGPSILREAKSDPALMFGWNSDDISRLSNKLLVRMRNYSKR